VRWNRISEDVGGGGIGAEDGGGGGMGVKGGRGGEIGVEDGRGGGEGGGEDKGGRRNEFGMVKMTLPLDTGEDTRGTIGVCFTPFSFSIEALNLVPYIMQKY
jgi:hypothetical protein